jgi:hypothetical protein
MSFFKKWYFLWAIFTVALLQQYATYCHIGITFDSPYYTAAAQSFAKKFVFLNPNGSEYTNWTPLFPILLSFFSQNVELWAKYIHLFSGIGTVVFLLLIVEQLIDNQILKLIFTTTIVFSTPLLLIHSFLWSESIFVFILCMLLHSLLGYIRRPTYKNLVILILISNLLYLQRNAGLFFVIGISSFLFVDELFTSKSIRYAIKKSVHYLAPSLSSVIFWQVRNHFFVVNLSDFRNNIFVVSWSESLLYMADIISLWLVPNLFPLILRLFLTGIVLSFLAFLAFKLLKNSYLQYIHPLRFLLALAFIFFIYIAFMLVLRMNVEEENERYLAPLFPLFFLFLFAVADKIIKNSKTIYKMISLIIIGLWLIYPIVRTLKNAQLWHTNQCKISKKAILF